MILSTVLGSTQSGCAVILEHPFYFTDIPRLLKQDAVFSQL